jgi:hypothetical protein
MNSISPIDVVIPWVDDTDPIWKTERSKYLGEYHESKENLAHYYRDWDTLRYVFRGIEKNMPWVRYVHFITYGHLPEWLNQSSPKLRIHRHKDFFSSDTVYPIFNPNPIEMNLMNIPGLSEKFIYFNDDMLPIRPVGEERFFRDNLPIDYLVLDYPRGGWLYEKIRIKDTYAHLCINSIDVVNHVYPIKALHKNRKDCFYDPSYLKIDRFRNHIFNTIDMYKWLKINHNPQAFLLSNLRECEKLFPKIIKVTRSHRFRDNSDVNQYIFRNIALMSGRFYPHYFNDDFCFVLASVKRYTKDRHNLGTKNFICLNDSSFLKEEEYPALREMVVRDMNALLPEKSSFEL